MVQTSMDLKKRKSNIFKIEISWFILSIICGIGVVMPIYFKAPSYPFFVLNILFVFVFIQFSRLILFTEASFLIFHFGLKLFFILIGVSVIFTLIDHFHNFETFIDNHGFTSILDHLDDKSQLKMETYIRNEMLFFGVGSIIISIILPFFLIISIWRFKNRGKHF